MKILDKHLTLIVLIKQMFLYDSYLFEMSKHELQKTVLEITGAYYTFA